MIELPTDARDSFADNQMDENYFPILWREDGYRTPQNEEFVKLG